jgi:hypothetical protein
MTTNKHNLSSEKGDMPYVSEIYPMLQIYYIWHFGLTSQVCNAIILL